VSDSELVAPSDRAAALLALKRAFKHDADPSILSPAMVTADPMATTSSGKQEDVQRAQLSMIRAAMEPDSDLSSEDALNRAGINPEMLLQMTSQPDFWDTYKDLNARVILVQSLPKILMSMTSAAEAGDTKAAKLALEYKTALGDGPWAEFSAQILHGDRESTLRITERLIEELGSLRSSLKTEASSMMTANEMIDDVNTKAVESLK